MTLSLSWALALVVSCTDGTATRDTGRAAEVIELDAPCRQGTVPGSECMTLEVTCEGLPPIQVAVQVSEPPEGVPVRKLLVVAGGGSGEQHWTHKDTESALIDAGYRVIDRRWLEPWMTGEQGIQRTSCRFAALLRWAHVAHGQDLPLCAIGNSMGATEIATVALSRPEAELIDAAILSSGPTLTRLDLACVPETDPGWAGQCETLTQDLGVCADALSECSVHDDPDSDIADVIDLAFEGTPCRDSDPDRADELLAESTWPTDGTGALPMPTELLFGANDCGNAAPFAALFAELSGAPTITVDEGRHKLQSTPEGRAAISDSVERLCLK